VTQVLRSCSMAPKAKAKGKAKEKARVEVSAEILKVFQAYDLDSNGTISREELTTILQILNKEEWTEDKCNAVFKEVDADKNEKIDVDEFVRWLTGKPADQRVKDVKSTGENLVAAGDELDTVLENLFQLYDQDQDGLIERMELLDGEESRLGKMNFGPKVRKATFTWFKESGATGSPTDGMYLSKEHWLVR